MVENIVTVLDHDTTMAHALPAEGEARTPRTHRVHHIPLPATAMASCLLDGVQHHDGDRPLASALLVLDVGRIEFRHLLPEPLSLVAFGHPRSS